MPIYHLIPKAIVDAIRQKVVDASKNDSHYDAYGRLTIEVHQVSRNDNWPKRKQQIITSATADSHHRFTGDA